MQRPSLGKSAPVRPPGVVLGEIAAQERLVDGLSVRRLLPTLKLKNVGPFVFFDHMGPNHYGPGDGINVRPHPHIGLATITYLFEGQVLHRDSLGSYQKILPGEVNWMSAGAGIVHSERPVPDSAAGELQGLQLWLALSLDEETEAPYFAHYTDEELPCLERAGAKARVLLGQVEGQRSPVRAPLNAHYLDLTLPAGTTWKLPRVEEGAVYVLSGALEIGESLAEAHHLMVLNTTQEPTVRSVASTRAVFIGGDTLDAPRFIEWNFVASSRQAIEAAKERWVRGEFPKVPGDESEYIPLPNGPRP